MKLALSTHIRRVLLGFSLSLLGILSLSCHTKPPIERRTIKVIFAGSPSYLCDDSGKLTDNGRNLFESLEGNDAKCKYTYILDPTLIRLDLGTEYSIATKIERSGVSAQDNPNRVVKLVEQNLENLSVSESFLEKMPTGINTDSLYNSYMSQVRNKDSILVLIDNAELDSITVDNSRYKVVNTIAEVRNRLLSIMCQNKKADLVLLINPPLSSKQAIRKFKPGFKPDTISTGKKLPTLQKPGKTGYSQKLGFTRQRQLGSNTYLTIIKGSEGCEGCTRYYSGKDDLGIIHEVRENNSTNCCPCGKTVQMNGRSYRMECSDEGNKLTLVE